MICEVAAAAGPSRRPTRSPRPPHLARGWPGTSRRTTGPPGRPAPARPPGGTAHRVTRPRRAGSRPGHPVRLLEPETAVDPLHPRWPVTVALAMAIAPGVQRRDLHPDGPPGPHHTVHHRHRRAVPVHGQLPVHDDVAHRPAPAGNPVFDHERLQVDKAVGVDHPSRSFGPPGVSCGPGTQPAGRAGCAARPAAWPRATRLQRRRHGLAGYRGRVCDRRLRRRGRSGPAGRRAAAPGSEAVLSEQMWRSRHPSPIRRC